MKRYPAYDPPEYVSWTPDAQLVAAFAESLHADTERWVIVEALDESALLDLYAGLIRTRLQDITLKRWVRTGVISKAWLGTGEEAMTVGPVHALDRARDIVAPMIRNAGACAEMGMPIADNFRSYLGTSDAPSGGRDLHAGSFAHRVLQPISHVGDVVPVVTGLALASRMRSEGRVVLTWIGDGSTKTGTAHEGLNFAAVQRVPAIFVIHNNQIALGTPLRQFHLPEDFSELPAAYGMAGAGFDGNNVLDAYAATRLAAERCRVGEGPVMLIGNTFRMGGHATHDEREARAILPEAMFAEWGKRDPIGLYEEYLKRLGIAAPALEQVEARVEEEIARAEAEALASRETSIPEPASAARGVYGS
ncbi:MAG TPA: thiamine pyrophosphate-dependent enzyme [Gemmatimonadales bacterium]|nr:thiamine pyrophosphate-dependent enzyme [Gemmatimonadales bacterium]